MMSDGSSDFLSVDEIRERIRTRVRHSGLTHDSGEGRFTANGELTPDRALARLSELRRNLRTANSLLKDVGVVSARPPGWKNESIQLLKRLTRRLLNWILGPLGQFNSSVLASLNETAHALEDLQAELASIAQRVQALEHSEMKDGPHVQESQPQVRPKD